MFLVMKVTNESAVTDNACKPYITIIIEIVPKAKSTHCHISSFYKERKGMMKRRTKLRKSLLHSHSQQTLNKLMAIEEAIITSHTNELSHEEA